MLEHSAHSIRRGDPMADCYLSSRDAIPELRRRLFLTQRDHTLSAKFRERFVREIQFELRNAEFNVRNLGELFETR